MRSRLSLRAEAGRLAAALAAAGVALALLGCGDGSSDAGHLRGTLSIDGSSAVFPFALVAADRFESDHGGVSVAVRRSDTSTGFARLCSGGIEIAAASRRISGSERAECRSSGVRALPIQIADDGIAIVASPELNVSCLAVAQLRRLWAAGSQVSSLEELGNDGETGDPLPDEQLSLFGPNRRSGTFEVFTERIAGVPGNGRDDYTPLQDDAALVEGVAGEPGGLGYLPLSYFELNQARLNLIAVDSGEGCVSPSAASIHSGEYPLSRPLFLYVNAEALTKPVVAEFLRATVSDAGGIADEALMVPMDGTEAERSTSVLEKALGGLSSPR